MNERIRAQMIKNPSSELWDIDSNKWTKENKNRFKLLKNGLVLKKQEPIKEVNKTYGKNAIKVLRVSDGFIYNSILECTTQNAFNNNQMFSLLREGKRYKRI